MIPGILSMGGAELLILLVISSLVFGAKRLGMKELSEEAACLGEEDGTKQRPRDNKDGKELDPNAGKGERCV
jgi:hypothetical protein